MASMRGRRFLLAGSFERARRWRRRSKGDAARAAVAAATLDHQAKIQVVKEKNTMAKEVGLPMNVLELPTLLAASGATVAPFCNRR